MISYSDISGPLSLSLLLIPRNLPARINPTLIHRPHIRPIVRQPPRPPAPLTTHLPKLNDIPAPLQILPLHILVAAARLVQPRLHNLQRGCPTPLGSQMRPFLHQILHSVHVADRSRDVERARVWQDAVGAEIQPRGLVSEVVEDGEEGADDLELHAVGARQRDGGRELQRADLLRLVDDEGVGLVEFGVFFAVLEEEFDGAEVDGLDAETEDVVAVSVDGERVGALSQE